MIKLFKFGPLGDICDASPFCVKVESYLKLAGLAYESQCGAMNLRTAPKRKLPFIEDNGRIVADSSLIILYLKQTYGDQVDAHLTEVEKAIAHAFIKMIDENLYWTLVHARWKLAHNLAILKQQFFNEIPFPINQLIAFKAHRDVMQALYMQGMGRHSDSEIVEIGVRDLHALADFLSDKPYFFGDKPTTLDAAAYGILSQLILDTTFTAPLFDKAKTYKNLVAFTERFHSSVFQK